MLPVKSKRIQTPFGHPKHKVLFIFGNKCKELRNSEVPSCVLEPAVSLFPCRNILGRDPALTFCLDTEDTWGFAGSLWTTVIFFMLYSLICLAYSFCSFSFSFWEKQKKGWNWMAQGIHQWKNLFPPIFHFHLCCCSTWAGHWSLLSTQQGPLINGTAFYCCFSLLRAFLWTE